MSRWDEIKFLVKREGIDGELRLRVEVEEHINKIMTLRAIHPVILRIPE